MSERESEEKIDGRKGESVCEGEREFSLLFPCVVPVEEGRGENVFPPSPQIGFCDFGGEKELLLLLRDVAYWASGEAFFSGGTKNV